jgi:phosphosulfolactate synthase
MEWWSSCISPPLGGRTSKPRTRGFTMVMDKGMGLSGTRDMIQSAGAYVDLVKLTAGTPLLSTPQFVREKISILRDSGIDVMVGGTLTEIAVHQGTFEEFLKFIGSLGCNTVEIADGSITLSLNERRDLVARARDEGFRVIAEVGKEEANDALPLDETLEVIAWDLKSGANFVNIEAREFGKVGIYREDGSIREDVLMAIYRAVPNGDCLLWEAPLFDQQVELVLRLGNEVNLANIPPAEVLRLETIRTGLIGDTLREALRREAKTNRGEPK